MRRAQFVGIGAVLLTVAALWAILAPSRGNPESSMSKPPETAEPDAGQARLVGMPESPLRPRLDSTSAGDDPPNPHADATIVIEGIVLRASHGAPVAGALVLFAAEEEEFVGVTHAQRTDEQGMFRLAVPESIPGRIHVISPGLCPWAESRPAMGMRHLDVYLLDGEAVSGRVVDELGRGIEGVTVVCHERDEDGVWPKVDRIRSRAPQVGGVTETDAEGIFRVGGLTPDRQYEIRTRCPGWMGQGGFPVVAPGDTGVRIVLLPLVRWRIRVTDASSGERVTGARLRMFRAPFGFRMVGGRREAFTWDLPDVGADKVIPLLRDYAQAEELPDKTVLDVTIAAPGYVDTRVELPLHGQGVPVFAVQMRPLPKEDLASLRPRAEYVSGVGYTGSLLVRTGLGSAMVLFVDGDALQDVLLTAGRQQVSAAGGRPIGAWWSQACPATPIFVDASDPANSKLTLKLRGAPVALRVIDDRGRPCDHFRLDIWAGGREGGHGWHPHWAEEFRDAKARMAAEMGNLSLPTELPYVDLPPGAARVRVVVPSYGSGEAVVVVPEDGKWQELEVVVKQGVWIDREPK